MGMGHREPLKGGAEYDIFSKYWRRCMCWAKRGSGAVKQAFRRRVRRQGKQRGVDDGG
jgi:hypothetical protein